MRKFFSLSLCLLLVLALAIPVFATEDSGTQGTEPATQPPHTHTWNTVTTPATCTTEGATVSTCSGCGEVTSQILPAAGHSYGSWTVGDASHSRSCTVCGVADSAAHSWTAGAVTAQPSCTATGTQTYTCACGASKTETLPVSAHTYSDWTITEDSHSRACSGCGAAESGTHSFGVTATVPATCKEEGATAYGCTVCGGIVYEILPKLTTHTYDNPCDPDCNVCEAVRETKHNFSTAWSRNSSQHWHECTLCKEKADIGSHYPGPAATEEKAQLCLTCGLTLTPKLNHSHKYTSQWTSDEVAHWYACSGCEEQKDYAEHVYDDACDPDCNVCGYRTVTAHTFDEDGNWLSDERGHWDTCTECGQEGEPLAHTPGPEATETEAQLCTVCGYELAPAQEHVHEFAEAWLTNEESHWKACECGEKEDEVPHTWDEGTENKAEKTVTYACTECGAERTEAAPEEAGFPWWIVLVLLLLVAGGAAVALVMILRKNKTAGKFHK